MARARAVGSPVLVLTIDLAVVGARHRDTRNGIVGEPASWAQAAPRRSTSSRHPHWIRTRRARRQAAHLRQPREGRPRGALARPRSGTGSTRSSTRASPGRTSPGCASTGTGAWSSRACSTPRTPAARPTPASTASWSPTTAAASSTPCPRPCAPCRTSPTRSATRVEVLVDGGVRNGLDVVKMVALGARAVLVGRAWAWAVAARGEAGVRHMLEVMKADIDVALGLTGQTSIAGPWTAPRSTRADTQAKGLMPNGAQALIGTLVDAGRDDLLHEPRHVRDALRRRAGLGAPDARGPRAVRGRRDRRRRRLRADGRQAGRDAAAPRVGPGQRHGEPAQRAQGPVADRQHRRRPRDLPHAVRRQLQSDIETVARNVSRWVRTSQRTGAVAATRSRRSPRRGAARPGRHADPARRRVVVGRRRAGAAARAPLAPGRLERGC